jgi:predicted lactoylglutathione lyase
MPRSLFINLPVEKLSRSVEFFTALGFTFNPQFTSEDSTCMIIGSENYAMLLERAKFSTFIDKPIAEKNTVEALIALSCNSTEEVRELCERAFSLGARRYKEPDEYPFMFAWGFEDLDGHIWELFWMNPEHLQS